MKYLLGIICLLMSTLMQKAEAGFTKNLTPHNNEISELNFTVSDTCQGLPTRFTPIINAKPDSYLWEFGDGETSELINPAHIYTSPGIYSVKLTATLDGISTSLTKSIEIIDGSIELSLFADSIICIGQSAVLNPNPDPLGSVSSYVWNTGETTRTIEVENAGRYWVGVELRHPITDNPTGCFFIDESDVVEYSKTVVTANQWYFGNGAGMDFNDIPPTVLTDGIINSPEAAASISDVNGDLLFYTDGSTVYNRDHEEMENGADIGGDNTSRGNLIVQSPEDLTNFYIFSTTSFSADNPPDLKFSMVDIKKDTSEGKLIYKDRLLADEVIEGLAVASIGNIRWLVSHESNGNSFQVFHIDSDGIGLPVTSSVGTVLSPIEEDSRNAIVFSPDYSRLGMSIVGIDNYVELYDFDYTTGLISNPIKVDIGENAPSEIYGISFSSSSDKLYVTTLGGTNSKLFQFDLESGDATTIEESKFTITEESQDMGELRIGPDGVMYVAVDGANSLASLINHNGDDGEVGFQLTGFDLTGRTSGLGLPDYVLREVSFPGLPSMAVGNGCRGQEIKMTATGTSALDEFFWVFGDGESSFEQTTSHIYDIPGNYSVGVRITNECGLDTTIFQAITIGQDIPTPTVPYVAAYCQQSLTLDAYDGNPSLALPTYKYNWSTGDSTQTIDLLEPSSVLLSVTDELTGCTSDTVQILVADARPQVDLGESQSICVGEGVLALDAANPAASYSWTINDIASGFGRFELVQTDMAGVFKYEVTVTDPLTSCIGVDSVIYTIIDQPQSSLLPVSSEECEASGGSLNIMIESEGTFVYQLQSGGSTLAEDLVEGPGTFVETDLQPGEYSVFIQDEQLICEELQLDVIVEEDCSISPIDPQGPDPLDIPTAVDRSHVTNSELEISFYPNPAEDHLDLHFESPSIGDTRIVLSSIAGSLEQMLFSGQTYGSFEESYNLRGLPNGLYILSIEISNQKSYHRIVISR